MIKKGILKNYPKFEVLKQPLGINLESYKFIKRKIDKTSSSSSMNKYGKYYFKLEKGNALFKTFDSVYKYNIRNLRIINELICQNLAKQIGLKYATYEPASMGKDLGLVSYNILKDKQKLVPLKKFLSYDISLRNNLVDISSAINHYKNNKFNVDESAIFEIYQIIVFDALTLQTDRNNTNINFIYDKTTNSFIVAPLFDNEYAFNSENIFWAYYSEINNYSMLLKQYSYESKFLNIEYEQLCDENKYMHNVINICNIAKSEQCYKSFLANALNKFNIRTAIKEVEKLGYEISNEYKEYLIKLTSHTKSIFKKELSKPANENTSYLYEEYIKL